MLAKQRCVVGVALGAVAVLSLTACAGPADGDSGGDSGDAVVVVASTNVWGDVAEQVGGDAVQVTSIISDPSQDPHSYTASASTVLALSKAAVVLENGGGYDDFMDQLLDASDSEPVVLNAVDISGKTAPAGGELNEHVWYDLPSVISVAREVATTLGAADPDHAAVFDRNADAFASRVDELIAAESRLRDRHAGAGVGITEPVPLYLTDAVGLVNETPGEFSEAIEEGDDVSAAVLKATLDLYVQHRVAVLVYNEQTSGPVTEEIEAAAKDAGVPVVPVTETLPNGLDYVGWMRQNIDALTQALR